MDVQPHAQTTYDREWIEAGESALQIQADCARLDFNEFCSFVLRDEVHGRPFVQSEVHEAWAAILKTQNRITIWGHAESGKSQQIGIGYPVWRLGHNPNLRVCLISETAGVKGQAGKLLRAQASLIRTSPELALTFQDDDGRPRLRPSSDPMDPWTQSAYVVERRPGIKEPSVSAYGVFGDVLGSRFDLIILDDFLSWRNVMTAHRRSQVTSWVRSSVLSRVTPQGQVVLIGNAWHREDTMHEFERDGGRVWACYRFPVVDRATGKSLWPEQWPEERIEAKRAELGPLEFARQMECEARSDEDSRIEDTWIELCTYRGRGLTVARGADDVPKGARVVIGVDLATGRKRKVRKRGRKNAKTVLFAWAELPDPQRSLQILAVEAGRWKSPEILQRIAGMIDRFGGTAYVEDNATQAYILDFMESAEWTKAHGRTRMPVLGFTTGVNKFDPEVGVESLFRDFAAGRIIIPNHFAPSSQEDVDDLQYIDPEIEEFLRDCRYYHPDAHTGDYLMAAWIGWHALHHGRKPFEHRTTTAEAAGEEVEDLVAGTTRVRVKSVATEERMRKAQAEELWDSLGIDTED